MAISSKAHVAPPRFYSPKEACGVLCCKLTNLYRLIHQHEIEVRHVGRSTLVHAGQVDKLILDSPIGLTVGIGRRPGATKAAKAPSKSTKKVSK